MCCDFGYEAFFSHTGDGVNFKEIGDIVAVGEEVDAGDALAAERLVISSAILQSFCSKSLPMVEGTRYCVSFLKYFAS